MNGFGELTVARNESDVHHYRVDIKIYIYNDSTTNKPVRNIKIALKNNRKSIIHENTPYNNSEGGTPSVGVRYKKIGIINVPPKSGVELELHSIINKDDLIYLMETPKEFLDYSIKNKDYSIFIRTLEYKNYINS